MPTVVRYAEFQCIECDAVEYEKLFENEQPGSLCNCSTCGSGQGVGIIADMYARNKGMRCHRILDTHPDDVRPEEAIEVNAPA